MASVRISTCKECRRKESAQWRENNRARYNARALKWNHAHPETLKAMNGRNYKKQNEKRDRIKTAILNDNPCLVCGESRHGCLTFHHLDPSEKESPISSHSLTWKKMREEISKCVVLCSNCHMLHHWEGMKLPDNLIPIDTSKYTID